MSRTTAHRTKIKVIHVITNLETGGAERMLYRLLSVQREEHLDLSVISLIGQGKFGEPIQKLGIPCQSLGFAGIVGSLIGFVRLMSIIYRSKPDVIHGWLIHGCVIATLALLIARLGSLSLYRTRVIWGIRNSLRAAHAEKFGTLMCLKIGKYLSGIPSAITYNSEQGREDYETYGFNARASCVIPNGFEPSESRELAAAPQKLLERLAVGKCSPVIGHCARYHPMKGHLKLLEAARLVCSRFPNALFVMAGRGVNEANVELGEAIDRLSLDENVLLLDEVPDIRSIAQFLDLHVLPSLWGEGFPNAIGEMMQQGVPCIASDIGAARELIGNTGAVIPPGDRMALSNAIMEFVSRPKAEKEQTRVKVIERINTRFGIAPVIHQYQDLYLLAAQGITAHG